MCQIKVEHSVNLGCTHFQKIYELTKNSKRQTVDMKQLPYRGLEVIRRHLTKLSRPTDLARGICSPWDELHF
jgi:glutamate racemase